MELAIMIRELGRRRKLLALGLVIAAVAAVLSVYRVEGTSLKTRSLQYSAGTDQVLVDSETSALGNVSQTFEPLVSRAAVYANFMTSPQFLALVGSQVGLSGGQIYAAGPVRVAEPRLEREPTDLKRNVELTGETKPYRLAFEQNESPTITINSQAPTTAMAVRLAEGAAHGLQKYVADVERSSGVARHSRIAIRQLGPATGAVTNGGISKTVAILTFLGIFLVWCVLVLVGARFRESWSRSGEIQAEAREWDPSEQEFDVPRIDPRMPEDEEAPDRVSTPNAW